MAGTAIGGTTRPWWAHTVASALDVALEVGGPMRATPSIRSLRRAVTAAAAMLTCAAALVTVAPPAAASGAPPWRFINSLGGSVTVGAGATSAVTASCPGGYIPIGGG